MSSSKSPLPDDPQAYETLYLAYVEHVKAAKQLRKADPQLARVEIGLAKAARQLLSLNIHAGQAEYRVNGTAMRLETVSFTESHRQFSVKMNKAFPDADRMICIHPDGRHLSLRDGEPSSPEAKPPHRN